MTSRRLSHDGGEPIRWPNRESRANVRRPGSGSACKVLGKVVVFFLRHVLKPDKHVWNSENIRMYIKKTFIVYKKTCFIVYKKTFYFFKKTTYYAVDNFIELDWLSISSKLFVKAILYQKKNQRIRCKGGTSVANADIKQIKLNSESIYKCILINMRSFICKMWSLMWTMLAIMNTGRWWLKTSLCLVWTSPTPSESVRAEHVLRQKYYKNFSRTGCNKAQHLLTHPAVSAGEWDGTIADRFIVMQDSGSCIRPSGLVTQDHTPTVKVKPIFQPIPCLYWQKALKWLNMAGTVWALGLSYHNSADKSCWQLTFADFEPSNVLI